MSKKPKRYPRRHLLCFSHLHAAMFNYLDSIESSTSFSDHVRRALELYTLSHPNFELDEFRRFAGEFSTSIGDEKARGVRAQDRDREVEVYMAQLKSFVQQGEKGVSGGHEDFLDLEHFESFESTADDF